MQPGQKADNFNVSKPGKYVYRFAVTGFVFQCVGILILLVWCAVLKKSVLESTFRKKKIIRLFPDF